MQAHMLELSMHAGPASHVTHSSCILMWSAKAPLHDGILSGLLLR